MTIKPVLLSVLAVAAATATRAAVYVDVQVSKLEISGTPAIGDRGAKLNDDLPSDALTLAVGYEVSPRIAMEARYTHIGDGRTYKVAPSSSIFPPSGGVDLPVMTYYFMDQSTDLYTVALPFKVVDRGAFSVSVAPLLHLEHSKFVFTNAGVNTLLPGPLPVIHRETRTELHLGGELKLAYRFNANVAAHVSYSYSALEAYDAQLLGAGLEFRF